MTVRTSFHDAIDRAFPGPDLPARIGIAVSGGSDSMALLHLMADWGRTSLAAATVDHGLRPEAAQEAELVSEVCAGLGIPHRTLRWRGWDGRGNLQAEARRSRYSLLADWAREEGCGAVCLGHTRDDVAETFLMRLAREAGLDGLSSMAGAFERDGIRFARPFLGEARADLRAELVRRDIPWVDDPSNEDDGFTRVKARAALDALAELGIDRATIAGSAGHLDSARRALGAHVHEIATRVARTEGGDVIFDRARLRALDGEISRRLLSAALRWVSSEDYPPRRDALSRLEQSVYAQQNATLHGCLAMVSGMTVRITREFGAVRSLVSPTDAPWDGRWLMTGRHGPALRIRALGEGIRQCPGWRQTGLPRQSLVASPAVWQGEELIAAPLAGLSGGWTASATARGTFTDLLLLR